MFKFTFAWRWVLVTAMALVALTTVTTFAAGTATIRSNPAHLEAPATEVFIISVPKDSGLVPAKAIVRYVGKTSHYQMTLKKAASLSWGGSVYASVPGTLTVDVYTKTGQLLKSQDFVVHKAKESWAPRIVIAALFIGIALWYWRRMQQVTNPKGPYQR